MKNDLKGTVSVSMARQRSAGPTSGSGGGGRNDVTTHRNHSNNNNSTAGNGHGGGGGGGLASASTGNLGTGSSGSQGGQRSRPSGGPARAGSAKYYDIASTILGKSGDVETVFFNAAKNGNVAKLEQILSQRDHANLDIDCRDKRTGNTALMWAAKRGHSKVVELMLGHGADPTLCNYEAQSAIELGFSPVKTLLLDWVEADQVMTPRLFLQAAWQGNLAMVIKILANGGAKCINCQNADGLTPLMLVSRDIQLFERLAAQLNRHYSPVEVAEELIKAGANIHVTDNDGRSSLHYASQSRAGMAERLVNTLVGGGLDPELRDKRLFTPIHLASQLGNTQNVVALIDGGSEVNIRGFGGLTPLHMTAYNDHQKTAVTLLNHGADVCIVDERGLTAVDLAKTRRMKTVLKEAWMDAATTTTTPKEDNTQGFEADTPTNHDNQKLHSNAAGSGGSGETDGGGGKKKKSAPVKKRPEVIFDNLTKSVNNNFPNGATTATKNKSLSNVEKCKQREKKILEDVEALKAAHPVLQRETTRMLGTTRTKILPQIGRSSSPPDRSQGSLGLAGAAPTPEGHGSPAVGGIEEPRLSLEETRLQLISRGRSISDIKLGIGRQSRLSTVPPPDADVFILEDLKSSISIPSPVFDRKGFHHMRTGSDGSAANMADIAASCEQFLPNTRGKRGTKHIPGHPSNGGSHPSSPAFITQQSFSFMSNKDAGGNNQDHELSPRQGPGQDRHRFVQAVNSPLELLRCRSLLKEEFVLEESRPKEAATTTTTTTTTPGGSDPTSSSTSSLSSSPRDPAYSSSSSSSSSPSSSTVPPYSSPSKSLKHDPSLTTLVEHSSDLSSTSNGQKKNENYRRNGSSSDVLRLSDEKLPLTSRDHYEFASKPLIRDPGQSRRIRRNSDNAASTDLSLSAEFTTGSKKNNFSPRFQKDRGLQRSSSQRNNTPSRLLGDASSSSLSPRLISTIHKSQSVESLSPKRSPSPDHHRQLLHNPNNNPQSSVDRKPKDYISDDYNNKFSSKAIRKLSEPDAVSTTTINKQRLISGSSSNEISRHNPNVDKETTPANRPIAPFSGKAKFVTGNDLENWESMNYKGNKNDQNNIRDKDDDSNYLFTPVQSAEGPKKSFSNSNDYAADSQRNNQVTKSCSDNIQSELGAQVTRPHTSANENQKVPSSSSASSSVKTTPRDSKLGKQAASPKDHTHNPLTKSSNDVNISVKKSLSSSSKTPLRKSVSNPSQAIGDKLAAKLQAVRSPSLSLSSTTPATATSKSLHDTDSNDVQGQVVNNMFVVSQDSIRKGSASKERMKERERIASAKLQKNETTQQSQSTETKKAESASGSETSGASPKDKPINKVVASIERSLRRNDAQTALHRKSVTTSVTKTETSQQQTSNRVSNVSQSVSVSKTSTTEKAGSSTKIQQNNVSSKAKNPATDSGMKTTNSTAAVKKEAKPSGQSTTTTAITSNIKTPSSSTSTPSFSKPSSLSSSSSSSSSVVTKSSTTIKTTTAASSKTSPTVSSSTTSNPSKQPNAVPAAKNAENKPSSKSEKSSSSEEPKQAKALDPNVILTPRSTEPLVKIKLKSSNPDAPLQHSSSSSSITRNAGNPAIITSTPLIVNPYEEFTSQNTSDSIQQTTKDAVVKLKKTPKSSATTTTNKSSKKSSTSSSKRPQSGTTKQVDNKKRNVKSKNNSNSKADGRPKSSKKSSKKKESQQEPVDNFTMDNIESENPDKAIISGIGWQLSTSCIDTSNVYPAEDIQDFIEADEQILYKEIVHNEADDDIRLTREFEGMPHNIVDVRREKEEIRIGKNKSQPPTEFDKQSLEVFKERITLNSPRFLEMKRRQESQLNIDLPVLTNDGFPPMNLDVTQASLLMMNDKHLVDNFYEFAGDSNKETFLDDAYAGSRAENNEAIQREIFLNKLTPIPEASYVSKTMSAISKFDKSIKGEGLSDLLEDTPRELTLSGRKEVVDNSIKPKSTNTNSSANVSHPKKEPYSYEYTYTSSGKTIKKSQSFSEKGNERATTPRVRKFSETKPSSFDSSKPLNSEEAGIDEAIEEILSNTISSTTSTLKGGYNSYNDYSNNASASNTLTEYNRNVLKQLTSATKDSPFHARSADVTARRSIDAASPLPPSPEDITKELENLNEKMNNTKIVKNDSNSTNTFTGSPTKLSCAAKSNSVSSQSVTSKPPLSNLPNNPRSNSMVKLKRTTSVRDTGSKGHLASSIDLKALEMSEEESQHLARVMSSLRHMELHAGGTHPNSSVTTHALRDNHHGGLGGSASAKFSKSTSKGDITPVGNKNQHQQGGTSLPASAALVRPSSTGAAASSAKFKGKFHELKEDGASGGGVVSGSAGGGGGVKKVPSSGQLVVSHDVRSSSARSGDKQVLATEDQLMESLTGDFDHAKDAEEIQNMYIRLSERRDSLCGSEISLDSGKSVDDTIQWKKGNVLGKGAFGTVWCGLTSEGELIAVKQIELTTMNQAKAHHEYEKIQEEVELLKTLDHINIVGYLGTSLEDNIVSIFMQFIPGGSLASILARFGALEESVFRRYTKQILEGVEYLHDNDVIHRDLKGANVMLMPTGVIKLIDFGCAKRLCINLNLSQTEILKSMKGTPFWMAPEVVNETGHGKKSDIWSIGCTVFEMATRKPPWANMNPMAAIFAIGRADKPVPCLPDRFSQDAIDFVSACMTRDQNERPSATDLLNHVFIARKNARKTSKAKEENVSFC